MPPHASTKRQQFVRLCDCGCGEPTLLALRGDRRSGQVVGQPESCFREHRSRARRLARRQQFVRICECGCGQPTLMSDDFTPGKRADHGQPNRYLNGHFKRQSSGVRAAMVDHHGYRLVYAPAHPAATRNGYVFEHRLVAERMLGRLLRQDEVCHHVNHQRLDNRPENLVAMTRSDHMRLHRAERALRQWSLAHTACVGCGTTAKPHMAKGLCAPCYYRTPRPLYRRNWAHIT